jgi:pentapeptide MXKDX repeat protein
MNFTKSLKGIFLLIMLFTAVSFAQDKDNMKGDMNKKEMMNKDMMKDNTIPKDMMKIDKNMDGIALKGYDPVSYFTDMKPEMGISDISYKWGGATWQFTIKDHMKMFKENPSKYAPQYGGYCAYAITKNKLVPADPAIWTMENGKLYLNVNADAQKLFRKDITDNIKIGGKNWKTLSMSNDKMDDNKMMNNKMDKNK